MMTNRKWASLFLGITLGCLAGCGGTAPTTPADQSPQLPDSGARSVDTATYTPGQPVNVSISVVPDNSSVAYAIEDTPPPGWTVSNINESGTFDSVTGKVKWGIFFNECPHFFSYTLSPSANSTGSQAFLGTLSVDGNDFPLTGTTTINHS